MPAKSKSQQRFMGMVRSAQKGEKPASGAVAKVAKSMKKSDVKDFASTKHKGLPNKKKKTETKVKSLIKKMVREIMDEEKNKGLWHNIHAKRKRGEKPAKKGDKNYPKTLDIEGKLDELTSFNVVKDKLVDLGFGNLVVSWRGTKKKVKDLNPDARLDYIMIEKTHNTLLKNKSMRYDGNDYKVTPQGKKYFKGTLQLEGKLTEAIQPSKAITKVLDMADGGYGKLGGKLVDGLSANLFKTIYNKANDTNKEKMNKMNEKQLYVFLTKLWSKFGKQVKI